MSFNRLFLKSYNTLALYIYYNAKQGIAYICKGLTLLRKATRDLFLFILFAFGLYYTFLISLLLYLLLYLFNYIKPNPLDTLLRFKPYLKTL